MQSIKWNFAFFPHGVKKNLSTYNFRNGLICKVGDTNQEGAALSCLTFWSIQPGGFILCLPGDSVRLSQVFCDPAALTVTYLVQLC